MAQERGSCHHIYVTAVDKIRPYGKERKSKREAPPNESRRSLVSLESRVGIWGLFSANALIHFPRDVRDRLINFASSSMWPSLPAN